jgi:hypothetical protein
MKLRVSEGGQQRSLADLRFKLQQAMSAVSVLKKDVQGHRSHRSNKSSPTPRSRMACYHLLLCSAATLTM